MMFHAPATFSAWSLGACAPDPVTQSSLVHVINCTWCDEGWYACLAHPHLIQKKNKLQQQLVAVCSWVTFFKATQDHIIQVTEHLLHHYRSLHLAASRT